MQKSAGRGSRIEGVLREATTDLQNAELPPFIFEKIVPVTTKASEIVPKVVSFLPLPFVDTIGAMALSVPINAVKAGYSLIPHEHQDQDQNVAKELNEFAAALKKAGIDLDTEYDKLGLDENALDSFKLEAVGEQDVTFLLEITGSKNLAVDTDTDPYVRVKFGGKLLTSTRHQFVGKNSLLLSCKAKDLFLNGGPREAGLLLEVCDFDAMDSDEVLGVAVVSPSDIYKSSGSVEICPILSEDEDGFYAKTGGSIGVRVQMAPNEIVEGNLDAALEGLVGLMVPVSSSLPDLQLCSSDESSTDEDSSVFELPSIGILQSKELDPDLYTLLTGAIVFILLILPLLTLSNVLLVQNGRTVTLPQLVLMFCDPFPY